MKKEIYLAGGCFWGVQKYFGLLPGVLATEVGYANGQGENPTYEQVYTGESGFAETLRLVYDGERIDLDFILEQFAKIIDPTTLNRQAADVGSHYRTGVYYTNSHDKEIIAKFLTDLQKEYADPIVVENQPLTVFYKAEERHQDYLKKNPGGYCHIPEVKYREARNIKL